MVSIDVIGIIACAARKRVISCAAAERIISFSAVKDVIPFASVQHIVSILAVEHVIPFVSGDRVISAAAVNRIVSGVAFNRVVTIAAIEKIISFTADDGIIACITVNYIITRTRTDRIVACAAVDDVITCTCADTIISAFSPDNILCAGAVQCIISVRTDDEIAVYHRLDLGSVVRIMRNKVPHIICSVCAVVCFHIYADVIEHFPYIRAERNVVIHNFFYRRKVQDNLPILIRFFLYHFQIIRFAKNLVQESKVGSVKIRKQLVQNDRSIGIWCGASICANKGIYAHDRFENMQTSCIDCTASGLDCNIRRTGDAVEDLPCSHTFLDKAFCTLERIHKIPEFPAFIMFKRIRQAVHIAEGCQIIFHIGYCNFLCISRIDLEPMLTDFSDCSICKCHNGRCRHNCPCVGINRICLDMIQANRSDAQFFQRMQFIF